MMTQHPDVSRCPWVDLTKPDYVAYHDTEWGVPLHDDRLLFEYLALEAAQAGLSWYTVLKKRASYRVAFDQFDAATIACYDEGKVLALLGNPGIIRNRAKIRATIHNARQFLAVQATFGTFTAYVWRFVDGRPIVHTLHTVQDYPATSRESEALSKDLRQRGFQFVGATVCYAFMQATGMVNDHAVACFRRSEILATYDHA